MDMCYFIYGWVDEKGYSESFLQISRTHGFADGGRIKPKDMFFNPDIEGGVFFRVTNHYCDCDTALGRGDEKAEELQAYVNWLKDLSGNKKLALKRICIMKFWESGKRNRKLKPVITVNIKDVDTLFLAGIDEDRIYCIELFKRYGEEYPAVEFPGHA